VTAIKSEGCRDIRYPQGGTDDTFSRHDLKGQQGGSPVSEGLQFLQRTALIFQTEVFCMFRHHRV
jgi:hypothetical protein